MIHCHQNEVVCDDVRGMYRIGTYIDVFVYMRDISNIFLWLMPCHNVHVAFLRQMCRMKLMNDGHRKRGK